MQRGHNQIWLLTNANGLGGNTCVDATRHQRHTARHQYLADS